MSDMLDSKSGVLNFIFGKTSFYAKNIFVKKLQYSRFLTCKELKSKFGFPGSGVSFLNIEGAGKRCIFCDMETDGGGWTLVASWDNASEWTKTSKSTDKDALRTPLNAFSSNFGNTKMNQMRVVVADEIDSEPYADFTYNWDEEILWKEVWAPEDGKNKGYLSSTPRQSLRKFDSATNNKLGYTVKQRWANISDWGNKSHLKGNTANWWKGLTQPGEELGIYDLSKYYQDREATKDGSLAISSSNQTDNSGQDTYWNTKIGYDDGHRHIGIGKTASERNRQDQARVDVESKLWIWIR